MKKILVTGGEGYIGSKLVLKLREKGYEVEVFDKPKNILQKKELEDAIKGKDIVWHFAALAELFYANSHPEETYSVNVQGTENVCELCANNNVVLNFISTACIYDYSSQAPSAENSLIKPADVYAASKVAAENIVKIWHFSKGLRYNILRLGTVYGPSVKKEMRKDMCIQKFLAAAAKGEPLFVEGDGKQARNFIHINDVCRALSAVTEKRVEGETINIAGAETISIREIADLAMKIGKSKKIIFLPPRKNDFKNQNVSIKKAKKVLGWQPEIKFEEGIKNFYVWLNP